MNKLTDQFIEFDNIHSFASQIVENLRELFSSDFVIM